MFGDAGLRDLAVESDVIAEGSINKVLEGKQCNHAVRFHKITDEALMRLVWNGFQDWPKLEHAGDIDMCNFNIIIQALRNIREKPVIKI